MIYVWVAIAAVIALVGLFVVWAYNGLVLLRNRQRNAFAQIDVQLKRRYDLIPNLVETVKGYMAHERQTLEAVTQARAASMAASGAVAGDPSRVASMGQLAAAESSLTAALGRLRLVAEAYPDLKANQSAALLMEELSSTENRIAFSRQAYNDATMVYNTRRETFPTNVVAGPLGFGPGAMFEITDAREREVVAVKLS
jgi:LemA protein